MLRKDIFDKILGTAAQWGAFFFGITLCYYIFHFQSTVAVVFGLLSGFVIAYFIYKVLSSFSIPRGIIITLTIILWLASIYIYSTAHVYRQIPN